MMETSKFRNPVHFFLFLQFWFIKLIENDPLISYVFMATQTFLCLNKIAKTIIIF